MKEPITIGLIAFERRGNNMVLPGKMRARLIAEAATKHQPDLLVCAGHSVRTTKQLEFLVKQHRKAQTQTTILLEVERDARVAELMSDPEEASLNDLSQASYLVLPDGTIRWLGRQITTTAADIDRGGKRLWEAKRNALRREYQARAFEVNGWHCNLICCGEINLVRASLVVRCLDPIIEVELRRADILINPTHDIMGRVALLNRKRQWLSRQGHNNSRWQSGDYDAIEASHSKQLEPSGATKAYVSISNWNSLTNSGRSQSPTSPQLATFWVNGLKQPLSRLARKEQAEFQYRTLRLGVLSTKN